MWKPQPLEADGGRPAVSWVASLPGAWTTTGERLVLFALACDSYDGRTAAPGLDNLAAWTGMHRSSVAEAVNRLLAPHGERPPLLERVSTSGGSRVRSTYRLLTATVGQRSGQPDSSTVGQLSGNRPANPTENCRATVGQPSGQPVTPFPSPENPSSLSPAAQEVARLLGLQADDERLQGVDQLLTDNGVQNPRGWLARCHRNGDLLHLLTEAHTKTTEAADRRRAADSKRCRHGVVNGDRIQGQCPACWDDDMEAAS